MYKGLEVGRTWGVEEQGAWYMGLAGQAKACGLRAGAPPGAF